MTPRNNILRIIPPEVALIMQNNFTIKHLVQQSRNTNYDKKVGSPQNSYNPEINYSLFAPRSPLHNQFREGTRPEKLLNNTWHLSAVPDFTQGFIIDVEMVPLRERGALMLGPGLDIEATRWSNQKHPSMADRGEKGPRWTGELVSRIFCVRVTSMDFLGQSLLISGDSAFYHHYYCEFSK